MANLFNITSGKTAASAAGAIKVCCLLSTPSTVEAAIPQIDISFDSVATGAGAVAVVVELVRYTSASAAGAAYTPQKVSNPDGPAAASSARINDTTDGGSPTILWGTLLVPTGLPFILQYPLGREWHTKVSDFIGLRITPQTGFTACNYYANLAHEE